MHKLNKPVEFVFKEMVQTGKTKARNTKVHRFVRSTGFLLCFAGVHVNKSTKKSHLITIKSIGQCLCVNESVCKDRFEIVYQKVDEQRD